MPLLVHLTFLPIHIWSLYVKQKRGETHPDKKKAALESSTKSLGLLQNITHAIHWFQVEAKIVPENPNTSHTKLQQL
jgi:hypothetical protein